MSMLRYLSPSRASGSKASPREVTFASSSRSTEQPQLQILVPTRGIVFMPCPEAPEPDGRSSNMPRDDHVLQGQLEVVMPATTPRRCRAIRVAFRSTIHLDMGPGRRNEQDVLFERKVEMIGATAEGIYLAPGMQRFDFCIILPSTLAPHDWHVSGKIAHSLYAEIEGIDAPSTSDWGLRSVSSTSSLFSFGQKNKRTSPAGSSKPSRSGSPRSSSPAPRERRSRSAAASVAGSGTATPLRGAGGASTPPAHALAGALANLDLNAHGQVANGTSAESPTYAGVYGGGSGVNPAHLTTGHNLSITRQESPGLPRQPSYDEATRPQGERTPPTPPEWLHGTYKAKRSVMIMYNPNPSGGVSELRDRGNGFVPGLGVWELSLVSDVWTICALLNMKLSIASIPSTTTLFAVRLVLAQTTAIISPRDDQGSDNKLTSTRHFTILEHGKRPPQGHQYPDKHYMALWRGRGAHGKDMPVDGSDGGAIKFDNTARLPSDDVARPSTLEGVVTPITVSHHIVLEVFFSVYSEDDHGQPMKVPGPGGLRMLRVSRPVVVPSCTLLPQVVDLPPYEMSVHDRLAASQDDNLTDLGLPGWEWCACGQKLEDMEARMRRAIVAEHDGPLSGVAAAAAAEDKAATERGRQRSI